MRIDIMTIFPAMFAGPFGESIVRRAIERNAVEIQTWNIRDFSTDKHRTVDDYPFGGGAGMLMKPDPIFLAFDRLSELTAPSKPRVLLMSPQGERLSQAKVQELAQEEHLVLLCGHYEGVDERVVKALVDDEISIGDYVLTGGELPAMVVVDSIVRLLPGVLGDEESAQDESFSDGLLEYPQYTRPRDFRGMLVPDVLLSGHHEQIRLWRRQESLRKTYLRRPDLLAKLELSKEDQKLLASIKRDLADKSGE
ncbi:MAG: tRNA (guanosine(37)-N1)-methyltransferase TrmD [Bacillota bacterium]